MQTARLTDAQRETYERDGYLVLPALFGPHEVEAMRREADRLVELTINASLAVGELSPRLDVQRREGRIVLRKIQPVNDVSEVFSRFSSDERLLGPLRDILGCEPVLMEEKLNYKQLLPGDPDIACGSEGESFPYHTDLHYFWLDGYPRETLSSSISIDETTPDNGPIRVLPGSQNKDWPLRAGWPPILAEGIVPEEEVVDVLAPPGSVMVFHSALVHASSENRTEGPRRLMIFSHYPQTHEAEPDKRNRPLRERSREHEGRYRELVEAGRFAPTFRMS